VLEQLLESTLNPKLQEPWGVRVSDIESACAYKIGDSLNEIIIEADVEFVCC
jgi:hypothetical protein